MTSNEPDFQQTLIRRFRNLVGVPSYHFQPVFAQAVREVFRTALPECVALELPAESLQELAFASTCWPSPVASYEQGWFFPFVAGDSIFEGYLEATRNTIPVACIDLDLALIPCGTYEPPPGGSILGPDISAVGTRFWEANETLNLSRPLPPTIHQVREIAMAIRLRCLMESHATVLWIGGMAHWKRMIERIETDNFDLPRSDSTPAWAHEAIRMLRAEASPTEVSPSPYDDLANWHGKTLKREPEAVLFDSPDHADNATCFEHFRLSSRALAAMTSGRYPRLLLRYATCPDEYDEDAEIRDLALEASEKMPDNHLRVRTAKARPCCRSEGDGKPLPAADVARTLVYARNLAVTRGFTQRPCLAELLTSAANIGGSRYAGSIYRLATQMPETAEAERLDLLDRDIREGHSVYVSGDRVVAGGPWTPSPNTNFLLIDSDEQEPEAEQDVSGEIDSAAEGHQKIWAQFPEDELALKRFIRYVMHLAGRHATDEFRTHPFASGTEEGIDVRETLRHWTEHKVYVREESRGRMHFTNAVIDWSSRTEHNDSLQVRPGWGWIDPDLDDMAIASRERDGTKLCLQEEPFLVHRVTREFSLLTLDSPTWRDSKDSNAGPPGFYQSVICKLVDLHRSRRGDNVYGWLDEMFRHCEGKPCAYFSTYTPSPAIYRVAFKHRVELVHVPLQRIPEPILRRHRTFRFLCLTVAQWKQLHEKDAKTDGASRGFSGWAGTRRAPRKAPNDAPDKLAAERSLRPSSTQPTSD